MINQPDTTTMEGRHAVERASLKFRIERNSTRLYSENWIGWTSSTGVFNWVDFSYRIHPDDLAAWAETQKRDVWTLSKDGDLFRNGEVRGCGIPYYANVQELIDALNGAPAADGMVINPDRYWYERSREADAEITELKRQLADKDAETEAASGRRHENS